MTVLCIILSLLATIIWSVRPVESVERDNGGRDLRPVPGQTDSQEQQTEDKIGT